MRNDIVVIVDPSFIGGITCFTESSVHGNDFVASHSGAFLPGIFCSSTIAAFASKCSIMQIHPSKYETNCQKSTITFYGVLNNFLWRAQRQQTPKTFRGNKPGERTRRTQFQLTKQTNSAQKKKLEAMFRMILKMVKTTIRARISNCHWFPWFQQVSSASNNKRHCVCK